MRIHIMGASCAGSTTLGNALSHVLRMPYFDTDSYFWEESASPYTIKRNPALRNKMLKANIALQEDCIVGGSLVSWGEEWKTMFDIVVFLYVPQDIRISRLIAREVERYGDLLYTNPERKKLYDDFITWAKRYDDRSFTGRNIKIHEDWLQQLNCKVLAIMGDTTVEERLNKVQKIVNALNNKTRSI